MSDHEDTGERFMRFHALYRDAIKSEFDALEFAVSVGRISEGQLNRSVVRVVRSKHINPCSVDPAALLRDTATAEASYQASR